VDLLIFILVISPFLLGVFYSELVKKQEKKDNK
jgi:hypothetical protein